MVLASSATLTPHPTDPRTEGELETREGFLFPSSLESSNDNDNDKDTHKDKYKYKDRKELLRRSLHVCLCIAYLLHILHCWKAEEIVFHSVMTMTKTKTNTKTKTKTMIKTKCSKDQSHAIFSKSWEFKDIRYDVYNDKGNDQEKDNDNDKDKD